MKSKTGVQEWANHSFNYQVGCTNGCKYCYAKRNALRFGLARSDHEFNTPNHYLSKSAQKLLISKVKGTIMFPTMHDINNINVAVAYLKTLITNKNKILIVSKAKVEYIKEIYKMVWDAGFVDDIEIRVTIGSADNTILSFWEPRAPTFEQRFEALQLAYRYGFKTSVSMEPMLDFHPNEVVKLCLDFCTEGIWLGFMNRHQDENYKPPQPEHKDFLWSIRQMKALHNDKIHFKNSVIKAMGGKDD